MIFNSRKIREELGMTQHEFANLIGDVSIATINNWDNDKTTPQPMIRPRLIALLKQYGYDRIEFKEGEGEVS